VQRYLTGRSIAESRLSLLFNAVAKIPMQFFVLFIGAMVFVFYVFVEPPVLFQHTELARISQSSEYTGVETRYHEAFERRREAALSLAQAPPRGRRCGARAGSGGLPRRAAIARRRPRQRRAPGGQEPW